jgi:hypothetical protein
MALAWNNSEEAGVKRISGNTIIQMYGDWLYSGAMVNSLGYNDLTFCYEEGRAISIGTLCRLFATPQQHKFLSVYLHLFYKVLTKVIPCDVRVCSLTFQHWLPLCLTAQPSSKWNSKE